MFCRKLIVFFLVLGLVAPDVSYAAHYTECENLPTKKKIEASFAWNQQAARYLTRKDWLDEYIVIRGQGVRDYTATDEQIRAHPEAQYVEIPRGETFEACKARIDAAVKNLDPAGFDNSVGSSTALVQQFGEKSKEWVLPIVYVAKQLFILLFMLELMVTFVGMALQGGTMENYISELVKRLVICVIALLLFNNPTFLFKVLDNVRNVASYSANRGDLVEGGKTDEWKHDYLTFEENLLLLPAKVVGNMLSKVEIGFSLSDITASLVILVASFFILWALAAVVIQLVLVLCEMYITVMIGMLSLALYALQYTRGITVNYFNALIGLGFKLVSIELLIYLMLETTKGWANTNFEGHGYAPYLVMVVVAFIFKELVVKIPNALQAVFGSGLTSNINATGAAAALATTTMAGVIKGMDVGSAAVGTGIGVASLAKASGNVAEGSGVGGKIAGVAKTVAQVAQKEEMNKMMGGNAQAGFRGVIAEELRNVELNKAGGKG